MAAKWSPARKAKFQATMAAKKAAKVVTTRFPIDLLPDRPEPRPVASRPAVSPKLQLAMEVVRLIRTILGH